MSKEWLAQLSATAAAKHGRGIARPQARPQAQPTATIDRSAGQPHRGLVGAIIGSIIRWAFISAIAGAAFVFVVSNNEYLEDSLGENVTYSIWYLFHEILPALMPGSPIDADAIYDALKPHAGLLPFLLPFIFGAAITLLFLPTVNAYRRRSGLRFFVLLINLAVLYWAWQSGGVALDLSGREGWINGQSITLKALIPWIILLILSFVGMRRKRPAVPLPAPARPLMAQGHATAPRIPSHAAGAATRNVSPTQMMPQRQGGSPINRSVSGGSWRRPR